MSTPRKKVKIVHVRLVKPFPFGREAQVYEYLHADMGVDGEKVELFFDEDPRFLRAKIGERDYYELIPLTNVSGIHVVTA